MSTWGIKDESDRDKIIKVIQSWRPPFTVKVSKGLPRTNDQNKLQRKWCLEAEADGQYTAEEYRGMCKLYIGVPIMRNEDDDFREKYDELIRDRFTIEQKLAFMMVPIDLAVTRIMNTKQKAKYLDQMYVYLTGTHNLRLTLP